MNFLNNLQSWFQRLTPESSAGRKFDPQQRKDLLAALASDRAADRWLAAEALAEGDPGRDGVAALAALLGDPDPLLRSEAARALGQIGGKVARQALVEAASGGGALAQAAAADGLGVLPASAESIAALASLLQSKDIAVRQSAAEALARIDPPVPAKDGSSAALTVSTDLVRLLQTDDAPMVRRAAALALGRWADVGADSVLTARQTDEGEDSRVRDAAALALSRLRRAEPAPQPAETDGGGEEPPVEKAEVA